MSKTIDCPECGEPMEVPAFDGDGVYSRHYCKAKSHVCVDRKGMFFAECVHCGNDMEPSG